MGRLSILPESLSTLETWLVRVFLALAAICLGPWLLILLYDILLYLWRSATYEFPYVGGRARGRQRPRAPSLRKRPDGHRRQLSLPSVRRHVSTNSDDDGGIDATKAKRRVTLGTSDVRSDHGVDEQ